MNISIKKFSAVCCLPAAALLFLTISCSKEASTSENEASQRYLEAWMSLNHPTVQPTGLGIYILNDQPGNGAAISDSDEYIFAEFTVTDLDGNISSTTSEALNKQVGNYTEGNYYGANVLVNDKAYTQTGVLEMIKGMKVGGTRTALIPGWLNVTKDYDTAQEYLDNCTGDNAIYTVKIVDKTADIVKWQVDSLEKYVKKNMSGVDSTMYGYYYKQLKAPKDTTSYPDDTTIYINYTGRLLNGQVFDTTIKDTAKVYGIYSSSSSYEPQMVTLNSDYTQITLGSSTTSSGTTGSTVVTGFGYCLSKIGRYEKGVCAFYSAYGYGYSGSGKKIPSFAPITFEIEVVDKPD